MLSEPGHLLLFDLCIHFLTSSTEKDEFNIVSSLSWLVKLNMTSSDVSSVFKFEKCSLKSFSVTLFWRVLFPFSKSNFQYCFGSDDFKQQFFFIIEFWCSLKAFLIWILYCLLAVTIYTSFSWDLRFLYLFLNLKCSFRLTSHSLVYHGLWSW